MIGKRLFRRGGEEGSVAVEMAVTLSALLFLILGAMQFALVFWNWNSMLLAVEEAGRYAMLYNSTAFPGGPPAATCSVATPTLANCAVAWANQNLGNNFKIKCENPDGSACTAASTQMVFKATYTFDFITSISLSRAIQVPVI